jgi:hypothetical protein
MAETPQQEILMAERDSRPALQRPALGRRLLDMTILWTLFGAIIGAGTGPDRRGTLDLVSFAIAGMIVLAPLGMVLGLIGGKWKEALIGAGIGLAAGAMLGGLGREDDLVAGANIGLIMGGIFGTTASAFYRQAVRLLPLWTLQRHNSGD